MFVYNSNFLISYKQHFSVQTTQTEQNASFFRVKLQMTTSVYHVPTLVKTVFKILI